MATLPITPSATRKSATKAAVAKPKPVPVPAAAALPAPVGPVAAPEPAPTPALAPSPPLSAPLSASAASASATTKSAVYKINARRKAIQEVLFKDSDLVLLLEDGRSLLVKDGALQYALQQSFILQFDEERVLSTEFIQNHPKVNYSLGNLDDKLLFSSGVVLPTYDGDLLDLTLHSDLPADAVPPPSAAKALPVPIPAVDPFINKYLGLGALAAGALLAAKGASSQSGAAVGTAVALAAPANTLPPLLSLGRGVADGATAAEATDSAGVVILNASSGNTVVVTLVDSSANTLTKTLTGTGYDQPVVLAASDIGSGPGQLQEGVISVSALASGSGGVRSSNGSTSFTLDTTAATLKDLALTANVGDGSTLKAGDVLTLTATYDSVVIGNPTPPTLSIGSKTGIALTPKDTSGSVRSWTYTISNNGTPDSGAIALSGGDYLQGVTDSAGNPSTNPAAGAPQLKPLSFYVDSSTPARPALSFGLGVDNGATAAEALASSGVLSLSAESGTRVEVSFTNGTRSFTKTLAATGNSQPVVLGADEVAQLQDGSINVSAIATNAAQIASSPGITGFNLDTQAPVLRRISLLSSNAASNSNPATPLRPGDVLTLTAEYSEDIEGSPAPTLQIGSETGVAMTPLGTSGQSRVWTYTISQTDSVNNPADQGAITVEGLGSTFLLHVHDRAGNPASSASPAPTQDLAFSADTSTPTAPTLTWGAGVSGGATAAEATQSSGVVLVAAESGTTVVLTFSDSASPANSVSKTITANGSTAQAVTLAASEIGNSGNALHDGTITVSAVATNAALVSSSNSVKAFTLDTTAPVLNSLALASSSGNNALKLGDVLTYSASYDGEVLGSPTAPTLTIGSETGIRMTPGITSGNTRTWTYTIRKSTGGSDLDDSGAVSVVGGNYLSGIADAAGNLATGAPTSANGSFSADANTPKAPTLTWGAGVSGGATAAEATQSSGVVLVAAESGTTVVLTFSDSASPANSVSKTITANGSTAQAVTLAASEIGNSGNALHDGTITVSAVATNAALVSSSNSVKAFTLDTTAPVLNSLALASSSGNNALKLGDVLTYSASYDGPVLGSPTAPTLTIGSETGIRMTPGITSGNTRTWTYTIRKSTGGSDLDDSGAVSVVGGNYLSGIADAAGNLATGAPTSANGSFSADANTPKAPTLTWGAGVSGGATAAEATQSSGVVLVAAESGTTVVLTFSDSASPANSVSKTITANGSTAQAVTLAASEIGNSGSLLHDGTITVSAVATNAALVSSSNSVKAFTLDTTAPVLNSLALASSSGNNALKLGDVLTYSASYDGEVLGSPTAPTLTIGSETGIRMTPGITSGNTRTWTYTIRKSTGGSDLDDSGAVSVVGGNYLSGIADAAGNLATGAPTSANGSFSADANTPKAPTLTWGAGVSGGATAAEATQSSGVVLVAAESGTTVVLTFSDSASPANSVSKTITANGSTAQAVTLAASEIGNSGNALHDGTITVSAVATNAALVSSSNSVKAFTLDTTAPVLNSLALASSSGNNALKLGDVLTYSASYDGEVLGSPTAPTLTIGSETGIRMTPGITSGNTRTWTYTIRKSTGGSDLDDSGAVSVVGGNYLSGIADAAGNLATGAPTSANGSFSADANTPKAPTLTWGAGVSGGATAAEATQSSGVVLVAAESGTTVVLTFSDSASPANSVSKTITANGSTAQAVTLAASEIGNSGNALHDGTITVSAVATNAALVSSSNSVKAFTLDTTAPVLNSLALASSSGNNALKLGDVLTYSASYDGPVLGSPTAPTLTIGSETGIRMTPGITSGNTRTWTYTIRKSTGGSDLDDSGAVSVVGGNYLSGIADAAGNLATGAPTSANGSFSADANTPKAPTLTWGAGVSGGATAAEATQSSGVVLVAAESGTTVVLTFSDSASPANSVSKTITANGSTAQAVTLAASEIGNSGNALHDGTITVSAVATNAALVSSSNSVKAFTLDTTAPVLNSLALASSSGNNALKLGDVLTYSASYDGPVLGSPTAPTLTIGSETGIRMTPGITSGNTRTWTYTIRKSTGGSDLDDSGAVSVVGGNYLSGIADAAGNAATGAPTSANGSFSADANTPKAPTLTWGAGVSGGATAAEATQSSGVVLVAAESGTTVVLTFSDSASPANSVSKTITANGSTAQAVTLAASEIGNSGNALHDGTITVSAVATNAALVSSSNSVKAFTLDTTAPVLNSLALASSSGNNALKLGDVLTYSASYDGPVEGNISAANAPTLTIGSETGIRMTPGITTGNTRTWTYTIRKSTGGSDLDDSGAVSVVGGNYLSGIADAAGNLATGAPTSANGSFSADANTPKAPTLTWGAGVSGGATAAEATQSSGVVLVAAESGTTVVLTFSDSASPANSVSKTITANGSTAQAVTLAASEIGNSGSLLHDGTITVSAVATNAALVSSNASSTSFALDTIQPIAPSLPLPAYASGGVSRAEALSSAGVLALTAESGSTVLVTFSDSNNHLVHKTLVGTGSAQPLVLLATDLGNVSGTGSSALGEGTITVTAIATDAAGNRSLVGSSSFTLDTLAPTLPALSGLAFSDDSATHGASNADFMTKVQSQTITATLAASLASGETLRGSVDGGGSWADLTAQLTSGTQLNWAVNLLVGQNQLLLKVSDAAGNDSAITSQAYELDQSAPTQLVTALALGADTAAPEASSTNSDFITRTAAQSIRASLSAALGSKESLWASLDGGANWVHVTPFVSGTSLHWSGVSLLAGTNTLLLKVADQAGNDGTVRSQVYEVDTSAPTTAVATVVFTNDAGRSSSDLITSQASQIIQGSLGSTVQAGETVYVSVNAGSVWLAASSTVGSSSYSLAGATLLDGSNVLLIKVCDVAGNSGPVVTRSYTLDTSPPNPPALLLGSGVADGTTADEATASSGVLTLSAESGASVVVTFSDGVAAHDIVKTLLGTGSAQPITLDASDFGSGSGKLQDGSITVAATATDIAGNVGGASSTRFILDTQPDTPVFALGTGVSDGATLLEASQATGVVTLSAPSGATVRVVFSDSHSDASPAHTRSFTITATGLAQPLTLQASDFGTGSGQLHEGTITVTASATDAAGNVSPEVSTTFTLDTIAPAIPVLAVIPSVATGGASRAEATDSAGVLTVNAELLSTVYLTFSNGSQSLTKVLTGSGNPLAVTLNSADLGTGSKQLQDGSITVTATATDVAGNLSSTDITATFTLDTRAPEAPLIVLGADVQAGATLADALQSRGVVLVSAEAASVVNVTFGNGTQSVIRQFTATGSAQAVTLDASDIGSANNQLQDGTITVTARATDAAGNSSSSSSSFVLDTRFATTQLLALGSGVAGFTVASEATQSSGVVTLDAESGSSVWVTFTDANNTSIVKTLIGSGVAGQAVTLGSADFGGFASQLHDGLISVSATGIDRAGNVSTAFSSFVLDTQAPAQAHVVLRQRTAAGVLTLADLISAAGLFQFNAEPGASVRAEFTCTDAVGGVSTLTKTFFYNDSLAASVPWQAASLAVSDVGTAANQLRPGSVSLRFVTVDAAGNASPPSQAATFTLDTSAYAAPVATLAAAISDGRLSKAEADSSPVVFTVPTHSGALFVFTFTDSYGNSRLSSVASFSASTQNVTLASSAIGNAMGQLHDGLISVSAVASSFLGYGSSAPSSASFVLDTTAPTLVSATQQPTIMVNGVQTQTITLGFSEPMDPSAFTQSAANALLVLESASDGNNWTTKSSPYSTVSYSGSTVTLALTAAAIATGAYRIRYTAPGNAQATEMLRDTAGNPLAGLTATQLTSTPQITGFAVSDTGNGNESNRGKAGEAVSVLVNFSETVSLSASTTYTVRVQIGSNSADFFDATLVTPATAPAAASSYTFSGTLPNTAGLASDALTITSLSNTGGSNNSINNSTGRALATANLPLSSTAYLVDSTAPSVSLTLAGGQSWSNTLPAGHSANIQFSFSENPGSSFSLQDITATGGTVSNLTGYGLIHFATFIPNSNTNSGSATIRVAAGSFSDAAGNANGDAPSISLSYDTLPPTPPVINLGTGVTDGATLAEATQASGVVSVQAESGQAVVLTFTGSAGSPLPTVTKTITGAGMGSAVAVVLAASDVTALDNGNGTVTVTVNAVATDAAGNSSRSNSSPSTFTLDTLALSPSAFTVAAGGTTDASTIFTSSPLLTVAGAGVPGGSRQFSTDGGNTWAAASAVTNALGAVSGYSFQLESNTSYAPNTIWLKYTDAAGNSSFYKESKTVTIDTLAPSAPVMVFGDGLGFTSSAGVVGISAESGSLVKVTFTDSSSHSVIKSITGAGSSVSLTLGLTDMGTGSSQLHDGSISVTAVATDSAGNASAASTSSFALNSSAPALFVKSGQNRFVNSTETGVDIEVYSTALQTGDLLVLQIDGASFTGNTHTVTADDVAAGRVSFAISKTLLGNTDGIKNISATLTPAAGGAAVNSSTLALTLDTAAPAAPALALGNAAIHGATLAEATASSGVVLVTAESGASVVVTFSDGVRSVIQTVTSLGANSPLPVSLSGTDIGSLNSQLREGSISVRAVATDAAGNTSAASSSSLVLDTSKPGTPTLALVSGVAEGATLAEATSGVFSFTAESGVTAWLSFSDGVRTLNKTFAVNSSAPQTIALLATELGTGTSQLHDGSINVSAVVLDAAGNVSAAASTRFVLDATAPDTPSLALGTGVDAGVLSDAGNGASRDEATRTGAVTVRAESGALVTLTFTDSSGHSLTKTITARGPQSAVQVTLAATDFGTGNNQLADGSIAVTAQAMDRAGNPSPAWASTSFWLDTVAPPTPVLALGNGVGGVGGVSGITNLAEATQATGVVTVTAVSGNQVRVTFSDEGGRSITKTLSTTGSAQAVTLDAIDIGTGATQLHDGSVTVTAITVDPAGNASTPSSSSTFTLDANPALAPVLSLGAGVFDGATLHEAVDASNTGNGNGVVFVIAESGSSVRLTFSDASNHSIVKSLTGTGARQAVRLTLADLGLAASGGAGTDSVKLEEGLIAVSAVATDAAGYASPSGSISFVLDMSAPTVSISSSLSAVRVGETATITLRFSEVPSGFDASDIVVSGGTLGSLSGTGLERTAVFTPTPGINNGLGHIRVPSGSYTDSAGNVGSAGTMPPINVDSKAPTLIEATLDGSNILYLNFDAELDPDSLTTPAQANARFAFNKAASGSSSFSQVPNAFSGLSVQGNRILLVLATPLDAGESATISYTRVAGDQTSAVVQDLAGNDMESIGGNGTRVNTLVDTARVIGFEVSDTGNGNGSNVGKGGETVFVTLTFNKAVTLNAGQHAIGLNVGPDPGVHAFSPILDSLGVSAATFTFTGTLPTNAGIDSNDLRLTSTQLNGVVSTDYNLSSNAYRVDTLAPTAGINSRQGLSLDASKGQYAELPAAAGALGGDITLEAWVYANGPQQEGATLLNLGSAGSNTISLTMDSIGRLGFEAFNGASSLGKAITTSTQPLALYTWNHLAATVSATNVLTLYVNGLPVPFSLNGATAANSATLPATIPDASRSSNSLGFATAASAFNGSFSDLRIYNNARSLAQIQSDRLGAVDTSDSNLIGYYPFNARPNSGLAGGPSATIQGAAGYSTIAHLSLSADTGSSPRDFITKMARQTITGTLLGSLEAGDRVFGSLDEGLTWSDLNISTNASTVTWSNVTLLTPTASGPRTIRLVVRDLAGNNGPIVTQPYVLNTTLPQPTLVLGSGVSGGATLSEATQSSGVLTINTAAGATVVVNFRDAGNHTVSKTIVALTATGQAIQLAAADIGSGPNKLLDGSISVVANITDQAGNTNLVPVTTSFILDTTAPLQTMVQTRLSSDNGASATDFVSNNPAQTITATLSAALAAGAAGISAESLWGSLDNGGSWTDLGGFVTGTVLVWPGLTLTGSNSLQLQVRDLAGNVGPAFSQAYVIDTTPPAAPAITLGTGIQASPSANGASKTEATQTSGVLTVAGEAQATVRVTFSDSAATPNRIVKSIITSGFGSAIAVSLDTSDMGTGANQLRDGTITVTASITDLAGNLSTPSASTTFKLDTVAPQLAGPSLRLHAASSQYATMPYLQSSSGTISGDITLEAWIYVDGELNADMPIINLDSGAAGNSIALKVNSQGALVFEAHSGSTSIMSRQTGSGAIIPNKWTHIALTVNNNATGITANVYVNGAIPSGTSGSAANNTPIPAATRSNAFIGYNGSNYFNGSIGDVRVYDYERTATQIAADLNGSADAGDANLEAWYPFLTGSSSGLAGPANMAASLAGSPAFTNIPFLSVSNDTAPNNQTNNDFVFNQASQTLLTGTLLYPYEAGETITVTGVDSYQAIAYPLPGSRSFTISNIVFFPGSNSLRIRISDASGNIGPECTVPYTVDTVAPTNGLPVGLQLNAASTQYATLPDFAAGTISGDLTLEAWINYEPVSTNPAFRTIIKLGSSGITDLIVLNLDFSAGASNAKLQFKYADGSLVDKTFTSGTALAPNIWNHVAVTVNSSQVLTFYINGIASGSSHTLPGTIASVGRTVNSLGRWPSYSNTEFNGSIRDVRIYDNSRSLTDIQSDITGVVDVTDQNLKAYYPLNLSAQSGLPSGTDIALIGSPAYVAKQSVFFSNDTSPDNTGNTDLVTKSANNQFISGKLLAPLQSDESVWVSTDNGTNWKKATAIAGTKNWSLPDAITLVAGNTIRVKVIDLAGNEGPIATQTYTLDTTAPVLGFVNKQVLVLDSTKKQYASLPADTALLGYEITLEAWVYASGSANGSYLFDFATVTENENRVSLSVGANNGPNAGKLIFESYNQQQIAVTAISTASMPINTWTHIAVVVSNPAPSRDDYTIYINGANSGSTSAPQGVSSSIRASGFVGKSKSNTGYFNGLISDVRILDYEQSAAGVVADMFNSAPTGPLVRGTYLFNGSAVDGSNSANIATLASDLASPVVPGYKQAITFSADTGESASDQITNTPEQTITFMLKGSLASDETIVGSVDNGVTWVDILKNGASVSNNLVTWPTTLASGTTSLKLKVSDIAGNYGPEYSIPYTKQSVSLEKSSGIAVRTGSYVQLPASAANLGTTITLEAWVLVNNATLPAGQWTYIFNLAQNTGPILNNNIILAFNTFGKLAFVASNGSNSLGEVTTTADIDISKWNHLAVTVSGSTVKLYVNGTEVATTGSLSASLPVGITRNNPLIGHSAFPGDADFNGTVSDVQIYNDVRTPAEIASDMNNFSTTDANLIGAYRFNGTLESAKSGVAAATIPFGVTAPAYFYPMSLSNDTGTYSNDFLTNIATNQTISTRVYGSLATGEKIWGKWNNGSTWTDVTSFVSGSQLSWPGQTLALEGTNTLQLKVTDTAGTQAGSILTQTFILDTTPPTASINSKKALVLDSGKQQYALFDAGTWGASDGFTIDAWIFVTALPPSSSTIIDLGSGGAETNNIILNLNANGSISFRVFNNSFPSVDKTTTGVITLNQWNHVGGLIAPGIIGPRPYVAINGVATDTSGAVGFQIPGSLPISATRNNSFVGHSNGTALDFNGMISDVRVYSRQGDIASDMQGTIDPSDPALRVYFPFNNTPITGKTSGNSAAILYSRPTFAATVSFSADTGADTHDFITNASSQTITGILTGTLGTGDRLFGSLNGGSSWTDISGLLSNSTFSWPNATLQNGTHTLRMKAVDAAGNDGTVLTQSYTLDTAAPALDLDSNTTGNDSITTISPANAAIFSPASAILPHVAAVTANDVAKITLDFSDIVTNPLNFNDRLKVGTKSGADVNLILNGDGDISDLDGLLALGNLTGLDYTYDTTQYILSLFKHDGSALAAAHIASALGNLQYMNSSFIGNSNIPGSRDFVLQLIDMAGNISSANGQIIVS